MVFEECGVLQLELSDFHGNMEGMGHDGRRTENRSGMPFNPGVISDPKVGS